MRIGRVVQKHSSRSVFSTFRNLLKHLLLKYIYLEVVLFRPIISMFKAFLIIVICYVYYLLFAPQMAILIQLFYRRLDLNLLVAISDLLTFTVVELKLILTDFIFVLLNIIAEVSFQFFS